MRPAHLAACCLTLTLLAACADYEHSVTPDHRIRVQETPKGMVAVPPTCADWRTDLAKPWDNTMAPQLGCANARNLAAMVAEPRDLIKPGTPGPASGNKAASSIDRYYNEKTAPLIDAKSDKPTPQDIQAPSSSGGGSPL